jgi:hypothetical protein
MPARHVQGVLRDEGTALLHALRCRVLCFRGSLCRARPCGAHAPCEPARRWRRRVPTERSAWAWPRQATPRTTSCVGSPAGSSLAARHAAAQPGWKPLSFGYHGDDGSGFWGTGARARTHTRLLSMLVLSEHACLLSGRGEALGEVYGTGDLISCMLDKDTGVFAHATQPPPSSM